jgi:hypothetical protein
MAGEKLFQEIPTDKQPMTFAEAHKLLYSGYMEEASSALWEEVDQAIRQGEQVGDQNA